MVYAQNIRQLEPTLRIERVNAAHKRWPLIISAIKAVQNYPLDDGQFVRSACRS